MSKALPLFACLALFAGVAFWLTRAGEGDTVPGTAAAPSAGRSDPARAAPTELVPAAPLAARERVRPREGRRRRRAPGNARTQEAQAPEVPRRAEGASRRLAPAEEGVSLAGQVVDPTGAPVYHARVTLGFAEDDEFRRARPLSSTTDYTDARGRFAFASLEPQEGLAVGVVADPGSPVRWQPVPEGVDRVRLVVPGTGSLEGNLRLHEPPLWSGVNVFVEAADGSQSFELEVDEEGRFGVRKLDSGPYDVRFELAGTEYTARVLEEVLVPRGHASTDSRLVDVDLLGTFHLFQVTVVDEAHRSLEADGFVMAPGDPEDWAVLTENRPGLLVLSREPAVDLVVRAEGFRRQRVDDVQGDWKVTLERGFRTAFEVENWDALDEETRPDRIELQPLFEAGVENPTGEEPERWVVGLGLRPNGTASVPLELKGPHRVRWLRRTLGPGLKPVDHPLAEEIVDVSGEPGESHVGRLPEPAPREEGSEVESESPAKPAN